MKRELGKKALEKRKGCDRENNGRTVPSSPFAA
jgi:hypothetical protein